MTKPDYQPRHKRPSLKTALKPLGKLIAGVHEACESVVMIGDRDFDQLVDAIKRDGLLTKIEINSERQLVDGRSRVMACYAAGVKITESDIIITKADPEAIARANNAWRLRTLNQLAMAATRLLDIVREQVEVCKKEGGVIAARKRRKLNTPYVTSEADHTQVKKRKPRATEDVATQLEVTREMLETVEKVAKKDTALAKRVEKGEMTVAEAAEKLGVKPKAKSRKPTPSKPTSRGQKPKSEDSTTFEDDRTMVIDRKNGIRSILSRNVTIYEHAKSRDDMMVYTYRELWWFGPTSDVEHESRPTREQAEVAAFKLIQSMIREES